MLAASPTYGPLATTAAQLAQQIRAGSLVPPAGAAGQMLTSQLDKWSKNVAVREDLLLAMAPSPVPAAIVFPPLRTTDELKKSLADGQALVVFHVAKGNLFGFAVSSQAEHVWVVGEAGDLQRALADWLRTLGNYNANRELAGDDLSSDKWRTGATKIWQGLFANARLDLEKTTDLAIVPDGWLWYLPFEALIPTAEKKNGEPATLIERVPLHYGPTASLAVGDRRSFRPTTHTGIVAQELAAEEAKPGSEGLSLKPLEDAVKNPVRLASPLAQPGYLMAPLLDQLIALDDIDVNRKDPYDWSPLPRSRGRRSADAGDSLASWMGLPYDGPERVIVTGLPTAAETGLKMPRRGETSAAAPGTEIFDATCALLASGARTVLVSRWRTGGQMNLQLVREFIQELQFSPADIAWQRSVMLAWETPLDAAQEPRLKRLAEGVSPPGADHPFFWAGYLLVDTGTMPNQPAAQPKKAAEPKIKPPETKEKPAEATKPAEVDAPPAATGAPSTTPTR